MLLENDAHPPLSSLSPSTAYSFYPYPLSPRTHLRQSIRGPDLPSSSRSPTILPCPTTTMPLLTPLAGPGPTTEDLKREKRALGRAEKRALAGKRPAGVGLSREAEELSDEENTMEDEKQNINMFGHRFLLPFGRRLTQMEMDAAPSPTPSEADQERRQEDRNLGSPHPGGPIGEGDETLDEGGQVDLDASVEDLDASVDDLDASMAEDEAGGDEGDGDEGDDDNMDE